MTAHSNLRVRSGRALRWSAAAALAACSGQTQRGDRENLNRSTELTDDDKATIGALYGGSCFFDSNPRDLGASVEPCR